MAVFTDLTDDAVRWLLASYDIGHFVSLEGISSGIENSNYYLETDKGRFVLTVFERLSEAELPYYLKLTHHLNSKGLSVSAPIPLKNGELQTWIQGKPCSIAKCLAGTYVEAPSEAVCKELGATLARMHRAVEDFPLTQKNTKGKEFWLESLPLLKPHMPEELFVLLNEEISRQVALQETEGYRSLPSGAVHADLFRNNSLIVVSPDGSEKLGGIIDFYFACNAPFLYDLAVVANDWCIDQTSGAFDMKKARALLEGYHSVSALSEKDHALWKDMLCAAALRFWVSRLYDWYCPREASLLKPLDPTHFERILRLRRSAREHELPWV